MGLAPGVYNDHYPHLFITLRYVNASGGVVKEPCSLGIPVNKQCPPDAYVKLSETHQPGSAVGFPAGHGNATPVFYHVGYYAPDNSWWIQYGGEWIGKVNASYWGGAAGSDLRG